MHGDRQVPARNVFGFRVGDTDGNHCFGVHQQRARLYLGFCRKTWTLSHPLGLGLSTGFLAARLYVLLATNDMKWIYFTNEGGIAKACVTHSTGNYDYFCQLVKTLSKKRVHTDRAW